MGPDPVAAVYWITPRIRGWGLRVATAAAVAALFAAVLALSPGLSANTADATPDHALRTGPVIYGSKEWQRAMPPEARSGSSRWGDVVYYAERHPFASAETVVARVAAEVGHVRPYYATKRNAIIAAYLIPLYALACVGIVGWWRQPIVRLTAVIVAMHMALVAVFFADYDGRFLVHVLPLIGLLAALGGARVAGLRPVRNGRVAPAAVRSERPSEPGDAGPPRVFSAATTNLLARGTS